MKKFMLKTLNYAGWLAASYGAGWLFGRVVSLLFSSLWTEEVAKTKPVLFWGSVILYLILLAAFSVAWATVLPVKKLYDWINEKIDDLDDDDEAWD